MSLGKVKKERIVDLISIFFNLQNFSKGWFNTDIFLLIFHLEDLSIADGGEVKSLISQSIACSSQYIISEYLL